MEPLTGARLHRIALLLAALLLAACAGRKMPGSWKDREIIIDGDRNEWRGLLAVPKGQNIAIGTMNDADYLYLLVSTADRPTMGQMLQRGLVLTIKAPSDKGEFLQITYPKPQRPGNRATSRGRGGSGGGRPDWDREVASLAETQPWFILRGPGKEDLIELPLWSESGIRLGLGISNAGQLVWEIRLPLETTPDNRYALQAAPGQTLAISLATATPNRDQQARRRGAGGGRGGGGGRRGGGGGRGGGFSGGQGGGQRGQGLMQPLNYKFTIQLAAPDRAASNP